MCQTQTDTAPTTVKKDLDQRHGAAKEFNMSFFIACFLVPLSFYQFTNVVPIYLTSILRIVSIHIFLTLHYVAYDKDNYDNKISQKQIIREKNDYLIASILHMYAQLALQLLFPGMFFVDSSLLLQCLINTALAHVFVVEPLYYVVHRWLHVPSQMKSMHGFHHMSINPIPSTSLVQNFHEHFIYIATFGPAMLAPYFLAGSQHWLVIMAYLTWFDLMNAYGHTNIRCRHWIWENDYSPLKYLFYTPEFHLGHHVFFNYNYGLFMPLWDHLFGTYRAYKKIDSLMPNTKQDFVFIGHNGGLGHLFTIPEYCFYNIYDVYRSTFLPIEFELVIVDSLARLLRVFMNSYRVSRYCINNKAIGRIAVIMRTPLDYMQKHHYAQINQDILSLIKKEHKLYNTRYFGLGNLNKMKQLNNGGMDIVKMIANDGYLQDKKIRIWTGDTLTAASVYQQLIKINGLKQLFFIGANGKIGKVICQALIKQNIHICIYTTSNYRSIEDKNITYTNNINDMLLYQYILIGKMHRSNFYKKIFENAHHNLLKTTTTNSNHHHYSTTTTTPTSSSSSSATTNSNNNNNNIEKHSHPMLPKSMFMLDYTAPFIPLFGSAHDQQNVYRIRHNRGGHSGSSSSNSNNNSNTHSVGVVATTSSSSHNNHHHHSINSDMDDSNSSSGDNSNTIVDAIIADHQVTVVKHIQIGLLKVKNNSEFLKGYYDICMGTDQNQIYPCHAGCIIHTAENREEDEVGAVLEKDLEGMWLKAIKYGFSNNEIDVTCS